MPAKTPAAPRSLALAVSSGGPASPEHKRFQTLLGKIEKARERLAAWQRELPAFTAAYAERVSPLKQELMQLRRAWAFELEAILNGQRWSKADAGALVEMLLEVCGELLDECDEPDAELTALHDRHSPMGYDELEQEEANVMKSLFERASGLDLGDEPAASMDELLERAQQRLQQEAASPPPPRRRKARKPTEAEQRITLTVREVYRKLASALHPDRIAPEATAAERELTTQRMQRANTAYEAGDLLTLLELQLQIEQVDASHVASIDAAQVRHFNKLLAEQLREIEHDIEEREVALCRSFELRPASRPHPDKLGAVLQEELRRLQAWKWQLRHDNRTLHGDVASARRFLKEWRRQQQAMQSLRAMSYF